MGKLIVIISILILSLSLHAAKVRSKYSQNAKIQRGIVKQDKTLQHLNIKISKIEKDLQSNNKKFVRVVNKRKQIEALIYSLRSDINGELISLKEEQGKAERVIRGIILSRIDDDKTSVEILSDNLMVKMLKSNLDRIKERLQKNNILKAQLIAKEDKFRKYKSSETEILQGLHQLEQEKQKYAHKYISSLEKQEDLKASLKKKRKRKIIERSSKSKYIHPLKTYIDVSTHKKDLKYIFKGAHPVIAPRTGQVIETTKISIYWEAGVVLNHGKTDNSIIYGSFTPNVKKGDHVNKGDIIGYTSALSKASGELYFGIRKDAKVEQASKYIDKKPTI